MKLNVRISAIAIVLVSLVASGLLFAQEQVSPININTADETTLTTLPGIGGSKAKAIVNYRAENGPFKTVDDLINVSGIGSKTLESIRDQVTVDVVTQ